MAFHSNLSRNRKHQLNSVGDTAHPNNVNWVLEKYDAAGRDLWSRHFLIGGIEASHGFVLWLLECENCTLP